MPSSVSSNNPAVSAVGLSGKLPLLKNCIGLKANKYATLQCFFDAERLSMRLAAMRPL
jgi:hypothetical protein